MHPKTLLSCLLTVALAGVASASPPSTATRVDPGAPCYRWPAVDYDNDGVFDRVDHCVSTPTGCTVDAYGCESDSDGDGVCDGVDQCPNTPAGMKVNMVGCQAGSDAIKSTQTIAPPPKPVEKPAAPQPPTSPPVSETERQLVERGRIRLENIYFETNSARLLSESETTLNEVGQTLEKFPDLRFEVEGHTDTRGTARHNQTLSQSRAEAVRAFLLDHFRLRADNLTAKGYGESNPETQERNQEELLRNRRVELRVLNPESLPRGVKVEKKDE